MIDKEDIWRVVDLLVVKYCKTIPDDLLEEYKTRIVAAVHELFDTVSGFYETEQEMFEAMKEFITARFNGENDVTDGYIVVNIPIVLPIEIATILYASPSMSVVDDIIASMDSFGSQTLMPLKLAIKAAKVKEYIEELHEKMFIEKTMETIDKSKVH